MVFKTVVHDGASVGGSAINTMISRNPTSRRSRLGVEPLLPPDVLSDATMLSVCFEGAPRVSTSLARY